MLEGVKVDAIARAISHRDFQMAAINKLFDYQKYAAEAVCEVSPGGGRAGASRGAPRVVGVVVTLLTRRAAYSPLLLPTRRTPSASCTSPCWRR